MQETPRGHRVSEFLKTVFPPRKRSSVDDVALQAAQEKRARRVLSNLRNWSRDSNWHRELLARQGER
jgi:hypothetical protein